MEIDQLIWSLSLDISAITTMHSSLSWFLYAFTKYYVSICAGETHFRYPKIIEKNNHLERENVIFIKYLYNFSSITYMLYLNQ